jgi:hypothetical protein
MSRRLAADGHGQRRNLSGSLRRTQRRTRILLTLRSKAERSGDESLVEQVSGFVHGYILWRSKER